MTHEEMLEEATRREKKNEEEEMIAELEKTGIAYYGNTLILDVF